MVVCRLSTSGSGGDWSHRQIPEVPWRSDPSLSKVGGRLDQIDTEEERLWGTVEEAADRMSGSMTEGSSVRGEEVVLRFWHVGGLCESCASCCLNLFFSSVAEALE